MIAPTPTRPWTRLDHTFFRLTRRVTSRVLDDRLLGAALDDVRAGGYWWQRCAVCGSSALAVPYRNHVDGGLGLCVSCAVDAPLGGHVPNRSRGWQDGRVSNEEERDLRAQALARTALP